MYRGYQLINIHNCEDLFYNISNSTLDYNKGEGVEEKIQRYLKEYLDPISGNLSAELMIEEWFPKVDCQVFISHSGKDKGVVTQFANWLYHSFGIRSFIDSHVWGYADYLLKEIDNKCCYMEDKEAFNYEKRNKSTAHVHMMLASSLTRMLDYCECVFFINTPESLNSADITSSTTKSPWIYHEIATTKVLEPKKHNRITYKEKSFSLNESLSPDLVHNLDLTKFTVLNRAALEMWKIISPQLEETTLYDNLDNLYKNY